MTKPTALEIQLAIDELSDVQKVSDLLRMYINSVDAPKFEVERMLALLKLMDGAREHAVTYLG